MQTVIVTLAGIREAHKGMLKYLEESDRFTIDLPAETDEELKALGGAATVVATGSPESVRCFQLGVALYSQFPRLQDPNLMDMRGFVERSVELSDGLSLLENGVAQFEFKVTAQ